MTQKEKNDDNFENRSEQIESIHPMTEAHRKEIKNQATVYTAWVLVTVFFALTFACMNFNSAARTQSSSSGLSCIFFLSGGFIIGCVVVALNKWLQVFDDLNSGTINSIEGKIALDVQQSLRGVNIYKLRVAHKSFNVSKFLFLNVDHKEAYRVYYARHSHVVLDVEPL
jgi:hypothetical protein